MWIINESGFSVEVEMIYLAEKHGFGNLGIGRNIAWISEKRPLFFFGIAGAVFTIIGLILGANVLYVANAGESVVVGSALVSVLFIIIGVFGVFTGLILNEIGRREGKE
jgi:membrane-bound ClpP family serine protease